MKAILWHADCREAMAKKKPDSVDAVICDPPYGLSFMGREWDHGVPGVPFWSEALRVLKPGGHLLAFGGTRTYHRLAVAIEDAGFEIRDCLSWMYGQGFPKSLDVSKAIDKAAGVEREVVGARHVSRDLARQAEQWQGWGTALKPAWEPIIMARKPFAGTVANNVLKHGTGAINVDGTRIGTTVETWPVSRGGNTGRAMEGGPMSNPDTGLAPPGRWPANVLLAHHEDCDDACHSECPMRLLDEQSGNRPGFSSQRDLSHYIDGNAVYGKGVGNIEPGFREGYNDTGGASRFFYQAKVSKKERNLGLPEGEKNDHPTCKPVAVMAWLCKLVTPPGGVVLDPFMGSGSTGVAAINGGFRFIGIDLEKDYCRIVWYRIKHYCGPSEIKVKL